MIKYLAGREANAIEGAETKTVSSEDTLFTKDRAYNRFPGSPYKGAAMWETDHTYDIDMNRVLNGGFETWDVTTVPNDWVDASGGTGVLSEEGVILVEGSASLKLVGTGGANYARCRQDFLVISGWKMTVDIRLRGDAVNPTTVQIFNMTTGQYLDSSGVWQSTVQTFRTQTAAAWLAANPVTFTVPTWSVAKTNLQTIRIQIETTTGTGYADACYCFPWIDFASVHNHSLNRVTIAFKIQHDSDSAYGSPTTIAATIGWPTFKKEFTQVGERYWRFLADGTNVEAIKYGELVLGQLKTLSLDFQPGSEVKHIQPRVALEGMNTQMQIINFSDDEVREYLLSFKAITEAQKNEIRDELIRSSKFGKDPLIIIPDDNIGEVIYGRYMSEDWTYTRTPFGSEAKGMYDYSIRVREDPFDLEIS